MRGRGVGQHGRGGQVHAEVGMPGAEVQRMGSHDAGLDTKVINFLYKFKSARARITSAHVRISTEKQTSVPP